MDDQYTVVDVSDPSVRRDASGGLMAASSFEIELKAGANTVLRCVKITDAARDDYELRMQSMGRTVNLKGDIRKTLERFLSPGSERFWDPAKEIEIELHYPDLLR
jgi:hypothetical protein